MNIYTFKLTKKHIVAAVLAVAAIIALIILLAPGGKAAETGAAVTIRDRGDCIRYLGELGYQVEAETADAYIERATYEIGRQHRVKVATSDGPEQLIILGHGALRVSASNFREEMEQVQGQISAVLEKNNQKPKNRALRAAMEKAQSPEKE